RGRDDARDAGRSASRGRFARAAGRAARRAGPPRGQIARVEVSSSAPRGAKTRRVGLEYPSERTARLQMVEVGRRLYARGLINGSEGNLSCRLGPRRLLCTPSGVNKGFLSEDQLVVTDVRGEPQNDLKRASTELL